MLKNAIPSERFIDAILYAYNKGAKGEDSVTCSQLWHYIYILECLYVPGRLEQMFAWDESKAKARNRIHTIAETIRRGHVPGLVLELDEWGHEVVVRE